MEVCITALVDATADLATEHGMGEDQVMGLSFRKSVRAGKGRRVHLSKSGASVSQSIGPLTVNSRGRFAVRLAKGLSYRGGCAIALLAPLVVVAALTALLAATLPG